jgi:hypothetical protein
LPPWKKPEHGQNPGVLRGKGLPETGSPAAQEFRTEPGTDHSGADRERIPSITPPKSAFPIEGGFFCIV